MATPNFGPHADHHHWDARYRDGVRERSASALLERWLPRLKPGVALDVACGVGRDAVLLAAYGWRVVGVDISPEGLGLAQQGAAQRGVEVELVALDVGKWPLPAAYFDLICVFRFLDRALCPRLVRALRPGGKLIYETFTIAQRNLEGGPRSEALLLQPGELPALFPALEQLEYYEGIVEEHGRPRALAGFVGGKKLESAEPND